MMASCKLLFMPPMNNSCPDAFRFFFTTVAEDTTDLLTATQLYLLSNREQNTTHTHPRNAATTCQLWATHPQTLKEFQCIVTFYIRIIIRQAYHR